MPFFDIPAQAAEASTKEPNKAALALINAVDLAAMRTNVGRPNLAPIRVDFDACNVAASDGTILVKLGLDKEAMALIAETMTATTGDKQPALQGRQFWVSPKTAKEMGIAPGWKDPKDVPYPDLERAIPTKFDTAYDNSKRCRPFFSFELMARVAAVYKALNIGDKGFTHFQCGHSLAGPAVDQRADAWVCGSSFRIEAELTLLVMPILNRYLED